MKTKAAVLRELNAPLAIEELQIDEIKDDELLVKVVACGICQTDISLLKGQAFPVGRPIVLGHEGSGVVEKVGADVVGVDVGSHVVMSFDHCGSCHHCADGHAAYCESFFVNFTGRRRDGSATLKAGDEIVGGNFFGQSSFSQYAVIKASNVVAVEKDLPLDLLGPLGCGIQTGAGAIMNVLKPFPGASVAVFGAGAVGLSAAIAARIMGAAKVIVVDLNEERLAVAEDVGATHVLNAANCNPVEEIKALTTGRGANFTLDASGASVALTNAMESLAVRGVCGIVGGGPPVTINTPFIMTGGREIKGIGMGDSVPSIMIPRIVDFYRQGLFPLDKLVRFYDFKDINQAIADAESGLSIKPVLRM